MIMKSFSCWSLPLFVVFFTVVHTKSVYAISTNAQREEIGRTDTSDRYRCEIRSHKFSSKSKMYTIVYCKSLWGTEHDDYLVLSGRDDIQKMVFAEEDLCILWKTGDAECQEMNGGITRRRRTNLNWHVLRRPVPAVNVWGGLSTIAIRYLDGWFKLISLSGDNGHEVNFTSSDSIVKAATFVKGTTSRWTRDTCFLNKAREVKCMVKNFNREEGSNDDFGDLGGLVQVAVNVIDVAQSSDDIYFLKSDGTIQTKSGQKVASVTNATRIVAGMWTVCAVKSDDSLECYSKGDLVYKTSEKVAEIQGDGSGICGVDKNSSRSFCFGYKDGVLKKNFLLLD